VKFLFFAMFAIIVALFLKTHALLILVPSSDVELMRLPSTVSFASHSYDADKIETLILDI